MKKNKAISEEVNEIIKAPHQLPSVSILLPVESVTAARRQLLKHLRHAYLSVRRTLFTSYPKIANELLAKLEQMINKVDCPAGTKSVCLFVSHFESRILYMQIEVVEKIFIGTSFLITDLVYNKKADNRFLLLVLNNRRAKLYFGKSDKLINVLFDLPNDVSIFEKDLPQKVANFSDVATIRENNERRFLQKVDHILSPVLDGYAFPLLVAGPEKMLGRYKDLSNHTRKAFAFISHNLIRANKAVLLKIIEPYLKDWEQVKEKELLMQIEKARSGNLLVTGFAAVSKRAGNPGSRMLIVERTFPGIKHIDSTKPASQPNNDPKYALDEVIADVLSNGGDVEFVSDGALKDFGQIALVEHYQLVLPESTTRVSF